MIGFSVQHAGMRSISVAAVLSVIVITAVAGGSTVAATPKLEISYDSTTGSTTVFIVDSLGNAIASGTWDAEIPVEAIRHGSLLPLRLIALLRDQLNSQKSTEADLAHAWMRDAMNRYADVPVSEIPIQSVALVSAGEQAEWCGTYMDGQHCGGTCSMSGGVNPCVGCNCHGKTTFMPNIPVKPKPTLP